MILYKVDKYNIINKIIIRQKVKSINKATKLISFNFCLQSVVLKKKKKKKRGDMKMNVCFLKFLVKDRC